MFLERLCGCLSDGADKKPVLLHSNPLLAHIATRRRKIIHYITFDIGMLNCSLYSHASKTRITHGRSVRNIINGNVKCSAGAVNALNEQVYRDHSGPYNGVRVECAT